MCPRTDPANSAAGGPGTSPGRRPTGRSARRSGSAGATPMRCRGASAPPGASAGPAQIWPPSAAGLRVATPRPVRKRRLRPCPHPAPRGRRLRDREQGPDGRRSPLQDPLEGVAQVLQEVPPVGHLHRVGRRLAGRLGVSGRPVPGDDLRPRVGRQPRRHSGRLAVREQVDGAAAFQIDEDGAVGPTLAEGEVVDAQDPGRWGIAEDILTHPTEPRVGARRDGQSLGET